MADMFDLSGKVALVTGASRGIGEAIARAYAERGADVIVSSRKQPACEEVAEAIRASGGKAHAIACHIGDMDALGALFANPCYTQIHPTCIPQADDTQSKLTLMSESLRNDGRVWVPKNNGDKRSPAQIPEAERDYYLERKYPTYGNLAPRDISSRAAKEACDKGLGVGPGGLGVYLAVNNVDAFLYRFLDGQNHNIFVVRREAQPVQAPPA